MSIVKEELFADRRKALEEEFFRKQNQQLIERLRSAEAKKNLAAAIHNGTVTLREPVLDKLIELGVTMETLASLALVPLVAVAWADGRVEEKEKEAVLKAAEAKGVARDGAAHALLEAWLSRRPGAELVHAWEEYIKALVTALSPAEVENLRTDILGRARQVAAAAGGFFRVGPKVSSAAAEILKRLERAFGPAAT